MSTDKTKELFEQLLAQLYEQQSLGKDPRAESYLQAQDNQFLGKISTNPYDRDSMTNVYGPYGSPYSNSSIFNQYSDYGSPYGRNSVNNPYCSSPPKLHINRRFIGHVSINPYVSNRIPTEAFLYSLRNDIEGLLAGSIVDSGREARQHKGESFIEAGDGTFLGKLNPNLFDQESIFNKFGPYGNKYSQSSIFNRFSTYGNQFNQLSPYNQFSANPPKLYIKGKFIAYLTKNQVMSPRVDPDELLGWAERNVPRFG